MADDSNVPSLEDTMYALLITNMRIYDTMVALLTEQNSEFAENLLEMHAGGNIMTPQISYGGLHIFNEQNDDDAHEQLPTQE